MGISGLLPFLKKNAPHSYVRIEAKTFHKKRISIDGYSWVYTQWYGASKGATRWVEDLGKDDIDKDLVIKAVIKRFLKFNTDLIMFGITPIWAWDGEALPDKLDTKAEREKSRKKTDDGLKLARENVKGKKKEDYTQEEIKLLLSKAAQSCRVDMRVFDELRVVCENTGIPSITAKHEGEYLASCLCIEKIAACVWSRDTDPIAIGCPLTFSLFEKKDEDFYFEGIFMVEVLKSLKMSYHGFRDLCILYGTDFNKNMKGYGPAKNYSLVKKYGSIENISEVMDTTCLNFEKVRELLTPECSGIEDMSLVNMDKTKKYSSELDRFDMKDSFSSFFELLETFPEAENTTKETKRSPNSNVIVDSESDSDSE
jgi:flap endonuclease-1